MFTDPKAGISPLIPRSLNTSTFRVFVQDDASEWITTVDDRNESVLNGFSRVGGLWAFLGGVFTILFGTSLLRILCGKIFINSLFVSFEYCMLIICNHVGAKPISIIGLAHELERENISRECQNAVRKIGPQEGLVAFISKYLVDISFLGNIVQGVATHPQDVERGLLVTTINRHGDEKEVEPPP
jgi:hypothetical protein